MTTTEVQYLTAHTVSQILGIPRWEEYCKTLESELKIMRTEIWKANKFLINRAVDGQYGDYKDLGCSNIIIYNIKEYPEGYCVIFSD